MLIGCAKDFVPTSIWGHERCTCVRPVEPQNQFLVLFVTEHLTVLVLSIHSLIISTQLLHSLQHLVTEQRRQCCQRRPLLQPGKDARCHAVATEPLPRSSTWDVRKWVEAEITRQRCQHLSTTTPTQRRLASNDHTHAVCQSWLPYLLTTLVTKVKQSVAYVRPSVCFNSILWTYWPLNWSFCRCKGHWLTAVLVIIIVSFYCDISCTAH